MIRETGKMLMLNSITYAYRARDFLEKRNIRAYVERVPANLRSNGCGYGLRVERNAEQIAELLNENGISVKNILSL
jgi:ribosomal protein L20